MKSRETNSSSEHKRIPFMELFAYSLSLAFTSSLVVLLERVATKSTRETLGTGTRMARPSSFPFISGITSAIALAAPVVVGIMESAAARALLKSLCGSS